jgi:hypothetical protein
MVKVVAVMTGALLMTVAGASAALADHGSAWSLRQSGAGVTGSGASAGAVEWAVGAILGAALVWAAAGIVLAARSGPSDGPDSPEAFTDRERKPATSVFAQKVTLKQRVAASGPESLSA